MQRILRYYTMYFLQTENKYLHINNQYIQQKLFTNIHFMKKSYQCPILLSMNLHF